MTDNRTPLISMFNIEHIKRELQKLRPNDLDRALRDNHGKMKFQFQHPFDEASRHHDRNSSDFNHMMLRPVEAELRVERWHVPLRDRDRGRIQHVYLLEKPGTLWINPEDVIPQKHDAEYEMRRRMSQLETDNQLLRAKVSELQAQVNYMPQWLRED